MVTSLIFLATIAVRWVGSTVHSPAIRRHSIKSYNYWAGFGFIDGFIGWHHAASPAWLKCVPKTTWRRWTIQNPYAGCVSKV